MKIRLYLDTSVFNHLFHDDVPERQAATVRFFERQVRPGRCISHISYVVLAEIRQSRDDARREDLLTAIADYSPHFIDETFRPEEVARLAEHYIASGVLARRHLRDALHVAIATVYGADALASWNFRHMVNVSKEAMFRNANAEAGYHRLLRFVTPEEVTDEAD